jgi:hypothetical protein
MTMIRTITLVLLALVAYDGRAMTDGALLEARYTQVPGTDVEYAQGAIEKNDLAHREIRPLTWLIRVEDPRDPATWQQRLNAVLDPKHGTFTVQPATPEEEKLVENGTITLQR